MSLILITGGTGFVGSELCRRLDGHRIRLLVRDVGDQSASDGYERLRGDVLDPATLSAAVAGVDIVIHLVAIIEESGPNTFDRVIREGTANLVGAARAAGVGRFIQMSAMGAHPDPSFPYLNAKFQAEEAVRASGIPFTIFRPSVIFGPGDGFINVLADLVRKAPVIPVVGSGTSTFQPIAVGDVADAFIRAINDPESTTGRTLELGGGQIYTYEQMLDVIAAELGVSKRKAHVPIGLMKTVVRLSSPLPKSFRPPVTREQLNMLALDNVSAESATAELIGRSPVALADGIGYIRNPNG